VSGAGGDGRCEFCRIVNGEVAAHELYSGPNAYAFRDLHPVAPVHVLVVPREHIADASELALHHGEVLAEMAVAAREVAELEGVARSGYRLVFNVGPNSGSQVAHLHMHVIGGRKMSWPPG